MTIKDINWSESNSFYRLEEAQKEIGRHHRDFKEISDLLDEFFKAEPDPMRAIQTLKKIRNIVG